MTGVALLETMSQQVSEQCAEIRAAAEREANVIVADARSQSAAVRTEMLDATQREMDALDERWRQKGEAEASKAELVVKNDGLDEVMLAVHDRIRVIAEGPSFPSVLNALLAELMAVAEGNVLVLAPPAHADHVKKWLSDNGHGDVPVQGSDEIWDGVALQDPEKTYRISNTLSARFAQVAEEARKICMRSLFDDGEG